MAAAYSGDASYLASGAALAQLVQKATPTVAVTSSQQPSVYGGPVVFTTTVTGVAGGIVPPGTVTFLDGAISLGTATLDAGRPGAAPPRRPGAGGPPRHRGLHRLGQLRGRHLARHRPRT